MAGELVVVTVNVGSEWDAHLGRRPGGDGDGSLEPCLKCGGVKLRGPWAHSPHWRGNVQVDCVGDEVRRGV